MLDGKKFEKFLSAHRMGFSSAPQWTQIFHPLHSPLDSGLSVFCLQTTNLVYAEAFTHFLDQVSSGKKSSSRSEKFFSRLSVLLLESKGNL